MLRQSYDMLEFYAGKANLSRYMKLSGMRTGSLDIKYDVKVKPGRKRPRSSDPMDILSPSGFAPLIYICGRWSFLFIVRENHQIINGYGPTELHTWVMFWINFQPDQGMHRLNSQVSLWQIPGYVCH